ncbi:WEB family protein [Zea mays]|uniref:WEB family protein n=1 Tax=Zea mays TaxID=4577 RepID=A0A3L6DE11_MAIZE|nr:WEB family protein [Zea mays]
MSSEAECAAPAAAAPDGAGGGRVEIDTSAPFESVREAVDRFGGSAVWSSDLVRRMFAPSKKHEHSDQAAEAINAEEQAAQLENELADKERETLDVLKELEATKKIIADLKLKIRKEATETSPEEAAKSDETDQVSEAGAQQQKPENTNVDVVVDMEGVEENHSGSVPVDLEQAKASLNRATCDLAAVRAAVELLRDSIAKEKVLLERAREKLSSNTSLVSSLEDDLDQTTQKMETLKDLQRRRKDPSDIFVEIKKMTTEVQQLRSMADDSKSEAMVLAAEIEQVKASISTAEVRCIAARKMEDAARAAEALALAEIKALVSSGSSFEGDTASEGGGVTLSMEEYFKLCSRALEADESSRRKVENAMLQVDAADDSESESVKRLEDARVEVEECKKALQEALRRVEAANHGKLAVEEILRRWKSESGHKRRSLGGSPRFKRAAAHRREDSHATDMISDASDRPPKPTLSIGQILSMKLMGPDGYDKSVWDDKTGEIPEISLGQIINRSGVLCREDVAARRRISGKRKKFALTGLSVLLAKQSKNKKKRESF